MDQVDQAAASIQEATNIYPMSHHIMYTVCISDIFNEWLVANSLV